MATAMVLAACTLGGVGIYAGLIRPVLLRAAEAGSHLAQVIVGY